MFKTISKLINKQTKRAFMFLPALGWREVSVDTLATTIFDNDFHKPLNACDKHVDTRWNENGVIAIYVILGCNANRKDVNRVRCELVKIQKRAYERVAQKKAA